MSEYGRRIRITIEAKNEQTIVIDGRPKHAIDLFLKHIFRMEYYSLAALWGFLMTEQDLPTVPKENDGGGYAAIHKYPAGSNPKPERELP